jgi:heptosyltransferase-2
MKVLIVKLGAAGDVVRTTTILRALTADVYWLTSDSNAVLLDNAPPLRKCVPWTERHQLTEYKFDLLINLEDSLEPAQFVQQLAYNDLIGVYLTKANSLAYTSSSAAWFDLSLVSKYGKRKADALKLANRRTYQDMLFSLLGFKFNGEEYVLPQPSKTTLRGDIAIACEVGTVWPMKQWAYYDDLHRQLKNDGFRVNILPRRNTIAEHLADILNHRYLVSGDTLPMHFALGSKISCLTIFNCTSPWEIYDYGVQTKIVSPQLEQYFYRRDFAHEATSAIPLPEVYETIKRCFYTWRHK